jgi:hypothetical protein
MDYTKNVENSLAVNAEIRARLERLRSEATCLDCFDGFPRRGRFHYERIGVALLRSECANAATVACMNRTARAGVTRR